MLDKYIVPLMKSPLVAIARKLREQGVTADQVTVAGFIAGLGCVTALAFNATTLALLLLLVNRLADGLDGELARMQAPTDAGAFLDISLDFIFYALFPVGFAITNVADNALPAAVLVASFVGTGATFLAFSSMAEKHVLAHPDFAYKGFYYLDGLAEGTETIICFVLMCLFPDWFAILAWVFAAICTVTAINRVVFGYLTLKRIRKNHASPDGDV